MNYLYKNRIRLHGNPYVLFIPFLIFYLIIVWALRHHPVISDETRYIGYAQNIMHGFYSPPAPNIFLWNGPGYPVFLIPFVALKFPMVCIAMLNAILLYLSVVILFKILQRYISFRNAFLVSVFWACNINAYITMIYVFTESLTTFLIILLAYCLIKTFEQPSKKYVFISGFILGYIILTKVVFAYVLLPMLAGFFLCWIFRRKNIFYQKSLKILLIALATTLPYLAYTFHLTGKIYYWGNSGGQQLYWMSTPHSGEYGDFQSPFLEFKNNPIPRIQIPAYEPILKYRHKEDMEKVLNNKCHSFFLGTEQDEAFKSLAIKNIISHPLKYMMNCISNTGRMLFNYPYSYSSETPVTLFRMPFNVILVVLMLFCIIPTALNWKRIIFPLRFMLIFTCLYLLASISLCALPRVFTIIIPVLLFWVVFIMKKSLKINWKFE